MTTLSNKLSFYKLISPEAVIKKNLIQNQGYKIKIQRLLIRNTLIK